MTVADTGTRPGSEVVQLYVRALDARYDAPCDASPTSARSASHRARAGN